MINPTPTANAREHYALLYKTGGMVNVNSQIIYNESSGCKTVFIILILPFCQVKNLTRNFAFHSDLIACKNTIAEGFRHFTIMVIPVRFHPIL